MNPVAEFVGADARGLITKETWQATRLACPRCANRQANVWVLSSDEPVRINGVEARVFLCISCQFVAFGLGGFKPSWDTARRAQQIIEQAFSESVETE